MNDEWTFAQGDPAEKLARVHQFAVTKRQDSGEIEFLITVHEYATTPDDQTMRFFAKADKQTNQSTVPFTPCGWGHTLLKALSECVQAVHRFPYEGPEVD